jgi:predicted amidohydrolase
MFAEKINKFTENTHIFVLPEMFNSGFTMQAAEFAEEMNGDTITWMRDLANSKNAVIAGSLIIKENNQYFNRFVWMQPNGICISYDKKHLFGMADEPKNYSAGAQHCLIEYLGWKIKPIVCYDLRFPTWCRNTTDYDVLLVVANWPSKRITHWDALLKARAIENQCYVVACNRVGLDANEIEHNGHSAIFDPHGEELYFTDEASIENIDLSKSHLQLLRRKYPFLRDRD